MLKILVRPPATALKSHLIESVYTLVVAGALYLFFLPSAPATAGGVVVLAGAFMWNVRRKPTWGRRHEGWNCEQPAAFNAAHKYGWSLCLLAGAALAAIGGHPANRITGLVIIAGGLAIEWADHECRFNPRCTRKSDLDQMLDDDD